MDLNKLYITYYICSKLNDRLIVRDLYSSESFQIDTDSVHFVRNLFIVHI